MDRIFSNNLMALAPVYVENIGDCTEVFVENHNPFIIEKTITTVLNSIYKYYLLDIKELNKISKKYINATNLLPIPFDNENIFIPFKSRIPKNKKDKAFGYFNLKYLDKVLYEKNYIEIIFIDKKSIKSLSKVYSFKNHLSDGNILRSYFNKTSMIQSKSEVYTPSNLDDLDVLVREISLIRKYIQNIF